MCKYIYIYIYIFYFYLFFFGIEQTRQYSLMTAPGAKHKSSLAGVSNYWATCLDMEQSPSPSKIVLNIMPKFCLLFLVYNFINQENLSVL